LHKANRSKGITQEKLMLFGVRLEMMNWNVRYAITWLMAERSYDLVANFFICHFSLADFWQLIK
jgi:hypothetical protein